MRLRLHRERYRERGARECTQWVTHGKLERFHLQAEDSIFLRGRNYRFFFRSSVSRLQVNKSAARTAVPPPPPPLAQRNGLPIFALRHNFRRRRGEQRRESSRAWRKRRKRKRLKEKWKICAPKFASSTSSCKRVNACCK